MGVENPFQVVETTIAAGGNISGEVNLLTAKDTRGYSIPLGYHPFAIALPAGWTDSTIRFQVYDDVLGWVPLISGDVEWLQKAIAIQRGYGTTFPLMLSFDSRYLRAANRFRIYSEKVQTNSVTLRIYVEG